MSSTFPHWIYDGSPIDDPFGYGERAVQFLRRLRHPSSTAPGKAFQLYDWQERIVRRIYGPRNHDRSMIVKRVLLFLPRGNRKTSLAAALALLHTIGPEAEIGGYGIFAAKDKDQAKIGFDEARNIIEEDSRILSAVKIYGANSGKRQILYPAKQTALEVISSDGGKAHGSSPTFILADELHVWKGRELWGALNSSRVKKSPLTIICTTAGAGQENLLFEEYQTAKKIARGEQVRPSFLPILFQAEPSDDWQDEATWHKANPGLKHGFVHIDEFRDIATDAVDKPLARREFLQYNLNIWQGHSDSPLFDMATYDAGHIPFDDDTVADLPAYVGVDMSVNGDLTAVVTAWRQDDGRVFVRPEFFVPGDDLQARAERDGVPYVQWRDAGLIHAIDGPVIEPEKVEEKIREIAATYDVREIGFDPAKAHRVMMHLMDDGLPVIDMPQKITVMGPAIGDLERTVNGFRIRHNAHPILRHHFDSVVASRNDTGLTRMSKGKRTDRIDGAIAAAIAVSRATANDNQPSFLELDEDAFDQFGREAA